MKTDSNMSGWFAGPGAENSERFAGLLSSIYQDYVYWRRNNFPTDGVVIDSQAKRGGEPFWDDFSDRLTELLARLKADCPFYSPRYAAHMVSEQTLPSLAGMFAGLLYNPNNVSAESAPVTVQMEIEVVGWICQMLGLGDDAWGHVTSGGTIANTEALWAARSVLFLPLLVRDIAERLDLAVVARNSDGRELLALSPGRSLAAMHDLFEIAARNGHGTEAVLEVLRTSEYNVVEFGLDRVLHKSGAEVVVLAPETCHYCIPKALDVLGLGRRAIEYVPVDRQFRMRSDALQAKVDEIEGSGKTIMAAIGVAGTTEEGAIDPIHEIVAVRKRNERAGRQSFWIHADAAYGGYLRTMVVPARIGLGESRAEVMIDGQKRTIETYLPYGAACDALESLGECDSIAVDPHKLGYVPYPAGAVCFKSSLVKPVLRQDAPYIERRARSPRDERRARSIGVYMLEGSKPGMVAAALWLSHGLIPLDNAGHGRLMQETIRNAGEFYTLLRDFPSLAQGVGVKAVTLCEPNSNIVCYSFVPIGQSLKLSEVNEANEGVYREFSLDTESSSPVHSREFFVSRTVLGPDRYRWDTASTFVQALGGTQEEYQAEGVFLLRSAVMNPWYGLAKRRGRYYLSDFVAALFESASRAFGL